MPFVAGQRWISEAEPELGLGRVVSFVDGRVVLEFPASGERRQYAAASAPLRRVAFRAGERIVDSEGASAVVASAEVRGGLVVYRTEEGRTLPEEELGDALSYSGPESRLLNGRVDATRTYELRAEALQHQHRRRKSPVRGFVGGRMDLILHQLYIAGEVTRREAPRVLLADEVGLGKTVEACLILHRLLATGRASRALVVVPESLTHQWFVELLRRFNLWFHIFDEARCAAIEAADPSANPFEDDQLVLCGLSLLLDEKRARQAAAAGWDVLIVDEAHHLRWSPEDASREYQVIEALSRRSEGLLLLTATPEQLGLAGHFARLRLLDPERYPDFKRFEEETRQFGSVATVANKVLSGEVLTEADLEALKRLLSNEPEETQARLTALARGDSAARTELVEALLDRHGTGRVMFRNTRAAVKGFPKRKPVPAKLSLEKSDAELAHRIAEEFEADLVGTAGAASAQGGGRFPGLSPRDPRIAWLCDFIGGLKGAKALVIARTREKALAIEAALRARMAIGIALFHEDLELIQRDRNAAWFADPEGAQVLLASEIGSEGRNFQFARHLVLFDLPLDPELVEQRIGRLDRIGQASDIHIHVPHVEKTGQEVLFRWFHEGLDAFGHNLVAGRELVERFGPAVRDLAIDYHETWRSRRSEVDALVEETRRARVELERRLEAGRDRLLEIHSHRPEVAKVAAAGIAKWDQDATLENFMLRVWDHYGVRVEDAGPRTYRVGADGIAAESFPGLPANGVVATLDRRTALSREDLAFLTWDHPMATGALDLLLGSPDGNSSFAMWPTAPERGLWLETIHLLECVAPPKLHVDRFLPATPLRRVIDARGQDVTKTALAALRKARLEDGPIHDLLDLPNMRSILPRLLEQSAENAAAEAGPIAGAAAREAEAQVGQELERLRALAAVNPAVRPEEIAALERQRTELVRCIQGARVRLDSARIILLGKM